MAANRSKISRMDMSRPDRGNPVLTDYPDIRLIKFSYLFPLLLLASVGDDRIHRGKNRHYREKSSAHFH